MNDRPYSSLLSNFCFSLFKHGFVLLSALAHWEDGMEGGREYIPSLPTFPGTKFLFGGNCHRNIR